MAVSTDVVTEAAFDGGALVRAVDRQRIGADLRWTGVAVELTAQSADPRERIGDHDVCPGALVRTVKRQTMSCQYALMLLRWLDRVPEHFLVAPARAATDRLPDAGPHQRLLWDLASLHRSLDEKRTGSAMTWVELGERLGCSPSRLTNLRQARQADMDLVMRCVLWLGVPSTDFIHASES